jgi:methylthioribose-1-phosphate isomerase
VAGAFGVALAAHAYGGDPVKVAAEAGRIAAARPTAVNLEWGVRRALSRLAHGPNAVLAEALQMLDEDGRINRSAATQGCSGRVARRAVRTERLADRLPVGFGDVGPVAVR